VTLLFTRARVEGRADGVHVRNPFGTKDVPWQVVREVRLDEGSPWAVLELHDDETVQMLAVQANDGDAGRRRRARAARAAAGPAAAGLTRGRTRGGRLREGGPQCAWSRSPCATRVAHPPTAPGATTPSKGGSRDLSCR
jgi:hypothetical protein